MDDFLCEVPLYFYSTRKKLPEVNVPVIGLFLTKDCHRLYCRVCTYHGDFRGTHWWSCGRKFFPVAWAYIKDFDSLVWTFYEEEAYDEYE